jgi:hypothetical protein
MGKRLPRRKGDSLMKTKLILAIVIIIILATVCTAAYIYINTALARYRQDVHLYQMMYADMQELHSTITAHQCKLEWIDCKAWAISRYNWNADSWNAELTRMKESPYGIFAGVGQLTPIPTIEMTPIK